MKPFEEMTVNDLSDIEEKSRYSTNRYVIDPETGIITIQPIMSVKYINVSFIVTPTGTKLL